MALPIVTGPDNTILRTPSSPVEEFDDALRSFVAQMQETLAATDNGIGLAAPQVGRNIQVFVIAPELAEAADGHTVFVNPEITKTSSRTVTLDEGCLSIPDVWHELPRPRKVTLKAYDEHGERFKIRAKGLLARLVVHEVDHLQGVLFIDRYNDNTAE